MLRFLADNSLGSCQNLGLPCVSADKVVPGIVGTLLMVAGALSVIFLIVGGLLFTTSAGDPGRVKRARETIIYAIIGVILSISAFALVSFINGNL